MTLEVIILTPEKVVFEGKVASLILPGEQGVFEILPYHKPLISRLISGKVVLDNYELTIRRGIVSVDNNKATIIIEE
jgi:F-type H+-transporting ATPase subunit epsilon